MRDRHFWNWWPASLPAAESNNRPGSKRLVAGQQQIDQWRKVRRQSIQILPVAVGFLLALGLILFVVNQFVPVPIWLAAILVGIATFSVLGDAINIVYLGNKLSRAQREEAEREAADDHGGS